MISNFDNNLTDLSELHFATKIIIRQFLSDYGIPLLGHENILSLESRYIAMSLKRIKLNSMCTHKEYNRNKGPLNEFTKLTKLLNSVVRGEYDYKILESIKDLIKDYIDIAEKLKRYIIEENFNFTKNISDIDILLFQFHYFRSCPQSEVHIAASNILENQLFVNLPRKPSANSEQTRAASEIALRIARLLTVITGKHHGAREALRNKTSKSIRLTHRLLVELAGFKSDSDVASAIANHVSRSQAKLKSHS